jgi:hypothetical protein
VVHLVVKGLQTVRNDTDLRSEPFGDDVEVPLDLFGRIAIHG